MIGLLFPNLGFHFVAFHFQATAGLPGPPRAGAAGLPGPATDQGEWWDEETEGVWGERERLTRKRPGWVQKACGESCARFGSGLLWQSTSYTVFEFKT